MKNLTLLVMVASLNISSALAQSDFFAQVAFYGDTAEQVKKDCKDIELKVRDKLATVEKSILGTSLNQINVKAQALHEVTSVGDGPDFVDDYCQLHFISFTEALGFEKVHDHAQKNLGTRKKARAACTDDIATMESLENMVFARTSVRTKPFKGGNQCDVIGIRVVPMLTQ